MLSAMRSNFRNVSNVLQEGVDADGGYLVPEEYDRDLLMCLMVRTSCVETLDSEITESTGRSLMD